MITLDGEDIDYDPDDSFHQIRSDKPAPQPTQVDAQEQGEGVLDPGETFPVVIAVDRALHLPLISNKARYVQIYFATLFHQFNFLAIYEFLNLCEDIHTVFKTYSKS